MVRFILNKYETIDMPQKIILWFYKLKKMKKKNKLKNSILFHLKRKTKTALCTCIFP